MSLQTLLCAVQLREPILTVQANFSTRLAATFTQNAMSKSINLNEGAVRKLARKNGYRLVCFPRHWHMMLGYGLEFHDKPFGHNLTLAEVVKIVTGPAAVAKVPR